MAGIGGKILMGTIIAVLEAAFAGSAAASAVHRGSNSSSSSSSSSAAPAAPAITEIKSEDVTTSRAPTLPPAPGVVDGEQKYQTPSAWPRSRSGAPNPPLYRDENGHLRHLDKMSELTEYVRALASEEGYARLIYDIGAAEQATYNEISFAQRLMRTGIRARTLGYVKDRVQARYGSTENAYVVFRQWVKAKLKPKLKAAVASLVVGQAVSSLFPSASREAKGGKYDTEYDDPELTDEELDRELQLIAQQTWDTGNHDSFDFSPLPGSVAGTPYAEAFMGPDDFYWPRSEPSYDQTPAPTMRRSPGDSIFHDRLKGDWLSERAGMTAANVLKTSIPIPPHLNYIHSDQSYSHREGVQRMPTPVDAPPTKRRALDTMHGSRRMETMVTQNYDPEYVPALPSSVSAGTAVHWEEYKSENRGFNVPLTDAPNIVGMGYDAETTERQLAESTSRGNREQKPPAPQADSQTQPVQPDPQLNAANQTNPTFQNANKQAPEPSGEKPRTNFLG